MAQSHEGKQCLLVWVSTYSVEWTVSTYTYSAEWTVGTYPEWTVNSCFKVKPNILIIHSPLQERYITYNMYTYTLTHTRTHIRTHICTQICTHMHVHIYTYTYTRTHMRTHTQTYRKLWLKKNAKSFVKTKRRIHYITIQSSMALPRFSSHYYTWQFTSSSKILQAIRVVPCVTKCSFSVRGNNQLSRRRLPYIESGQSAEMFCLSVSACVRCLQFNSAQRSW